MNLEIPGDGICASYIPYNTNSILCLFSLGGNLSVFYQNTLNVHRTSLNFGLRNAY